MDQAVHMKLRFRCPPEFEALLAQEEKVGV